MDHDEETTERAGIPRVPPTHCREIVTGTPTQYTHSTHTTQHPQAPPRTPHNKNRAIRE
mgnify:FL=1